tara:strand:- start:6715 stop:8214 length:1500 start_codon:yes stop_codon:yes gene_type:complete
MTDKKFSEFVEKTTPLSTDEVVGYSGGDNIRIPVSSLTGAAGTITSVDGTLPISVDNTDPAAPDISIEAATTSLPGSMSAADKIRLDALPDTPVTGVTGVSPIEVDITDPVVPAISIDAATTSLPGSMSAADKTRLDAATDIVDTVTGTAPIAVDISDPTAPDVSITLGGTTGTSAVAGNDARLAGTEVSALSANSQLDGTELLPTDQGGAGVKVTTLDLLGNPALDNMSIARDKFRNFCHFFNTHPLFDTTGPAGGAGGNETMFGSEPYIMLFNGTGAGVSQQQGNALQFNSTGGVARLRTGSSGYSCLHIARYAIQYRPGTTLVDGFRYKIVMRVSMPSVAATESENYSVYIGLMLDSPQNAQITRIGFTLLGYDGVTPPVSGDWQAQGVQNGYANEVKIDTEEAPSRQTAFGPVFQTLEVEVIPNVSGTAAGKNILWSIDGTQVGDAYVDNASWDLPDINNLRMGALIQKSSGTANRDIFVDACLFEWDDASGEYF